MRPETSSLMMLFVDCSVLWRGSEMYQRELSQRPVSSTTGTTRSINAGTYAPGPGHENVVPGAVLGFVRFKRKIRSFAGHHETRIAG